MVGGELDKFVKAVLVLYGLTTNLTSFTPVDFVSLQNFSTLSMKRCDQLNVMNRPNGNPLFPSTKGYSTDLQRQGGGEVQEDRRRGGAHRRHGGPRRLPPTGGAGGGRQGHKGRRRGLHADPPLHARRGEDKAPRGGGAGQVQRKHRPPGPSPCWGGGRSTQAASTRITR
jgi:hypothetical protein